MSPKDLDFTNDIDSDEPNDFVDSRYNSSSKAVTPNRPKPKSKARLAEDEEDRKLVELLNNWQPIGAKPKPKKK